MAVQTWQSGACTVTFDDVTGEVTVSGQGEMTSYYASNPPPWAALKEAFRTLIIENGVTYIGHGTFDGCSGFTGSLTIPESVTEIGGLAFKDCSGFTGSLTIPEGVIYIETYAFSGCSGFTGTLTIPDSVTGIGSDAFNNCSGFTGSLTIPDSVTDIWDGTFSGCSGFTGTLTIPDSVTSIGRYAFSGCSGFTGTLTIPKGVIYIETYAFSGCSGFTGTLTIPESVTEIGEFAFYNCSGFHYILNYAKTQTVSASAFGDIGASTVFYGYPENTDFKTAAGDRWRDIRTVSYIVSLANKSGGDLYPRTKGAAVYLGSGKTVEAALGGVSFWRGTQVEYDALTAKPANTVYCIVGGSVIVT